VLSLLNCYSLSTSEGYGCPQPERIGDLGKTIGILDQGEDLRFTGLGLNPRSKILHPLLERKLASLSVKRLL
jgi:hypothetical protein